MKPCHKIKGLLIIILLLINVILSVCVLCRQTKIEADRVGGRSNYQLVQQIYHSKAFQTQQKAQLEQALQQLNTPATTQTAQPQVQLPTK